MTTRQLDRRALRAQWVLAEISCIEKLSLVFHDRLSVGLTDSFEGDDYEVLRS